MRFMLECVCESCRFCFLLLVFFGLVVFVLVFFYDGLFEWLVYGLYVVYGVEHVVFGGVFILYEMQSSSPFVCDVFY